VAGAGRGARRKPRYHHQGWLNLHCCKKSFIPTRSTTPRPPSASSSYSRLRRFSMRSNSTCPGGSRNRSRRDSAVPRAAAAKGQARRGHVMGWRPTCKRSLGAQPHGKSVGSQVSHSTVPPVAPRNFSAETYITIRLINVPHTCERSWWSMGPDRQHYRPFGC